MDSNDEVDFAVEVSHFNGEIVLAVRGDLDMATAPAFRAALETFDREASRLVIDLSAVTFMDCAGLRPIAGSLVRQHQAGGSLSIRNPSRQIRQILTITGLDQHVTIDQTQAHD